MAVLHRPRSVGRITSLVVDTSERGTRIGRALVAAAEETLASAGCGLGFADEAPTAFVVRDQVGSEKLQRDGAIELLVDGFVDDTYPALAKLFEDFVMGNGLAGHDFRVWR